MAGTTSAQRYVTLTAEALADALRALPGWSVTGGHLVRTLSAVDPWRLLERVQRVEDELDHHSVVTLDAGGVTFGVWTHVRSGLTAVDVELAQRISAAAEDAVGREPSEQDVVDRDGPPA